MAGDRQFAVLDAASGTVASQLPHGGSDIIDNNIGAGPAVVTKRGSDFELEVSRCAPSERAERPKV